MSLLAAYYAAKNEEAAATTAQTYAQMNLINQQTANFGDTAAAQRDLTNAQAGATRASTGKTVADTAQVPLDAATNRDLTQSRTAQNSANTALIPEQGRADIAQRLAGTAGTYLDNQIKMGSVPGAAQGVFALPQTGGMVPNTSTQAAPASVPALTPLAKAGSDPDDPVQGRETGGMILSKKDAVQGKAKKPGPTDTVPAMLTPGEAVLNKGAAEHYGPSVIESMNKMGLLRMGAQSEHAQLTGQPDPHAPPPAKGKGKGDKTPPGKRAGYAEGTASVPTPTTLIPGRDGTYNDGTSPSVAMAGVTQQASGRTPGAIPVPQYPGNWVDGSSPMVPLAIHPAMSMLLGHPALIGNGLGAINPMAVTPGRVLPR